MNKNRGDAVTREDTGCIGTTGPTASASVVTTSPATHCKSCEAGKWKDRFLKAHCAVDNLRLEIHEMKKSCEKLVMALEKMVKVGNNATEANIVYDWARDALSKHRKNMEDKK